VRQHVYDRYAFLLELSRSTFRGFMLQSPETRTRNGRRLARSHAPRSLQRDDVLESAVPTVPKIRVADEWLWANQMVVKDAIAIAYRPSEALEPLRSRLDEYMYDSLMMSLTLNNGVPVKYKNSAGILITGPLRPTLSDPEKPIRAAAFAGWALVNDDEPDGLTSALAQLTPWLGVRA